MTGQLLGIAAFGVVVVGLIWSLTRASRGTDETQNETRGYGAGGRPTRPLPPGTGPRRRRKRR